MGLIGRVTASALGAVATLAAGAAAAEQWVTSSLAPNGDVYSTDVSTVTHNGDIAQSWVRVTKAKPARDAAVGRDYQLVVTQRFDDCRNRRFSFGSFVERDGRGVTVRSGTLSQGWQEIPPGSVAEGVWKLSCAVAAPPQEEPFLPKIGEGDWAPMGASKDGKFKLFAKLDQVLKLDGSHVLVASRSDYVNVEWIDQLAVRYIVSAVVLDCDKRTLASFGADFYVAPDVRAKATRIAAKDMVFQPAEPGSFIFDNMKTLCAAAVPAQSASDDEAQPGAVFSGTAWGVDKGYLVTASHVIAHAARIDVYAGGEKVGAAKVVSDDPANDLAILKFAPARPGKIVILPLAPRSAALGKSVFTLGYPEPGVLGQHIKMTAGQVSSTAGLQDDARFLQISVPIQQGNSGGPLIGWDGQVVGVIDSKLTKFDEDGHSLTPEDVNYAVKASYLRPMLEELPDLKNYTVLKAPAGPDQLVAAARKAVYMLIVVTQSP